MRLIDADKLKNDIEFQVAVISSFGSEFYELAENLKKGWFDTIDRQKPVEATPVKHGEWIEVDDAIITGTCSVCGWNAIFAETDVTGMPYCPNCGAKMA